MSKSLPAVLLLILAITVVSSVFTYWRGEALSQPHQLESKGLTHARRDTAIFYAGVAVVVGVIGCFVFRAMFNASPDEAASRFLMLAIGIGITLEVMGAIVFKMRGLAELTALHVMYIASYGLLLPQIVPV